MESPSKTGVFFVFDHSQPKKSLILKFRKLKKPNQNKEKFSRDTLSKDQMREKSTQ